MEIEQILSLLKITAILSGALALLTICITAVIGRQHPPKEMKGFLRQAQPPRQAAQEPQESFEERQRFVAEFVPRGVIERLEELLAPAATPSMQWTRAGNTTGGYNDAPQ